MLDNTLPVAKRTRSHNAKTGSKEGNPDNEEKLKKQTKRQREVPLEDKVSKEKRRQPVALPLKFTFGVEEPPPPEKSENEKEMDKLWAMMARSCETGGSTDPAMIKNEDNVSSKVNLDTAPLCRQGSHQFKLDEEIGIVCKLCSYVKEETRYIVPAFSTNPERKPEERLWQSRLVFFFYYFQNQDSGCHP